MLARAGALLGGAPPRAGRARRDQGDRGRRRRRLCLAGGGAGLVPGTKVGCGAVTATVLKVTSANASLKLDGISLAVGQTGSIDVKPGRPGARAPGAPLRAQTFVGGWPELITPAQAQEVRHVPLGAATRAPGRLHATLVGNSYVAASRDGHTADGEARVIATWDALAESPL